MSVKSDKVKSGYSELSEQERLEVRTFIREFDALGPLGQSSFSKSVSRTFNKSLGPTSGNSCPCCGKS